MKKTVLHICPALGSGGIEKLIIQWNDVASANGIRFVFAVYRKGGIAYEYFRDKGYPIYELKRLKDVGWKAYEQQIIDIIEKEKIDILHINAGTLTGVALRAAKKAGVQSRIVHAHTNKYNLPINKLVRSILLWLARLQNNVYSTLRLGCSKEAAAYCFGSKSTFKILHNGIDLELFKFNRLTRNHVRQELGVSNNKKIIGFVGRLSEQKNPLMMLDIYKAFKHKDPNSVLLIVGDGELKDVMQNKIRLEQINDVVFVGSKKDVVPYYAAMDVIVMPSLYEGLLIVAIEAQSMGTPIVISEHVPKEVIITNIVRQVNLNAPLENWVEEITKMSNMKRVDYRGCLSENGYDMRKTTREMISIYEDELNRIRSL